MVILSRPHLIFTANQSVSEATETRKACSEQCILGIPLSLCMSWTEEASSALIIHCLQEGMWTEASVDLPNCRTGLSAAPEFLLAGYSTNRHCHFPGSVES